MKGPNLLDLDHDFRGPVLGQGHRNVVGGRQRQSNQESNRIVSGDCIGCTREGMS